MRDGDSKLMHFGKRFELYNLRDDLSVPSDSIATAQVQSKKKQSHFVRTKRLLAAESTYLGSSFASCTLS